MGPILVPETLWTLPKVEKLNIFLPEKLLWRVAHDGVNCGWRRGISGVH